MRRSTPTLLTLTVLLAATSTSVAAQRQGRQGPSRQADLSDSALVATIDVRGIGPAVMSGRVVDIAVAVSPGARGGQLGTVIYIAAATGGVWKSTNGGVTWSPILDEAGVGSVGDVTVAPSNSDIVWVGTGEANNMRSSSYGNGVYKSVDGGATFEHMGLRTSQHVGRIVVHPTDPNVVWVAAVGPLWAAGGERGVFKTTDGGESWTPVLTVDENTGATDLVIDPTDPDVLYASTLQRERRAYSYVGGGPGSGIWKSTDGGDTWRRLENGLPTSDMGRIGLDIARSQPRTLYAVIEGSEAGVYRTDNGGGSWRQTDDIASIPWYFGQIRVDPNDPEVVYHLGVPLSRSEDGGESWERIARQVHVDHHSLWINPENSNHVINGNDGGLYISHDYGETWDYVNNLPISQFYAVGLSMEEPFFGIHGGLQDNNTWGGPSGSRQRVGIRNSDWFTMAGGDGFYAAVDPTDPDIAYVESQNGNIQRFDGRTGERKGIRPQNVPGEPPYRFNWSAPIKISPHDPGTLYFAANHVFKSVDRGDSWTRLGEDLTQAIDRDSLPMMGSVPDDDAVSRHQGTAVFSNISTLDVSARVPGLLATGSDDGVVAISRDDGQTWTKVLQFPGVPDTTYVSRVALSQHDEAVIYATLDGHRSNDFRPHVLRSSDFGLSWTNISNNLPEFGSVRAFAEHHRNPNLLFVGTEIAPFVSLDGGATWTRIQGGMPPSPVHDMAIHPRDNALVIATHGRGFYLIDDLGPLEHLAEAKAARGPFLFPAASPVALIQDISGTSGTRADRDYTAPNPVVGTTISYLLTEAGGDVTLEITGPNSELVRSLDSPGRAGLNHVQWDLTTDLPWSGPPQQGQQQGGGGFGGFGGFGGGGQQGPMAVPGSYTVRLTLSGGEDDDPTVLEGAVTVRRDDMVRLTDAQLRTLFAVRMRHRRLAAGLTMALRSANDLRQQLTDAKAAMDEVDVSDALQERADSLESDIDDVLEQLRGPERRPGQPPQTPDTVPEPSLQQRVGTAAGVHRATMLPTEQESEALESIPGDLEREVGRLNRILTETMPSFFQALGEAGVPWSPGRPLRMPGN